MALLTSPPSKPKSHIFVPLSRLSHQHRGNVASPRPVPQLSIFPKFGTINESKPPKHLTNTNLLRLFHANNDKRVGPVSNAAFTEGAEPVNGKRIILSDVVVNRPRRVFSGRKWNSMDMSTAGVVLAMHLLSLFAPFHCNWAAFGVAIALYIVTGLFGITLSFHRNLSHRSFKLPKWLEYLFAYCGALALQVRFNFHINCDFFFIIIIITCVYILLFLSRAIQLIGWAHIGTTISFVILRETHIAQLKVSGLVTWVGYLIPIL